MTAQQDPKQQGSTEQTARDAQDHPALDWPARAGMFAYGAMYLLVAWLAVQLLLREPAGSASGSGAFEEVAQQPLGSVALWLAGAGLTALAVWQVCQAVGGHRGEQGIRRWGARSASAGRGLMFGALAALAVGTATGESHSGHTDGPTARLMSMPLGPVLVGALGLGIASVGLFSIYQALNDHWRKGLEADGRTGAVGGVLAILARVGYFSRGGAFLVMGGFFVWAAVTQDPKKSGGLDQAIVRVRDEAFGPWLIAAVAFGFGCYGAFHAARAWYLRGA